MLRTIRTYEVAEYTFAEVEWKHNGERGFKFHIHGDRYESHIVYPTLDHAMAAAIAAKHTGHPGAGGTGVGSAADWFMKMIRSEDNDGK